MTSFLYFNLTIFKNTEQELFLESHHHYQNKSISIANIFFQIQHTERLTK